MLWHELIVEYLVVLVDNRVTGSPLVLFSYIINLALLNLVISLIHRFRAMRICLRTA